MEIAQYIIFLNHD